MIILPDIKIPQDISSQKAIDWLYDIYLEIKVRSLESKEEKNRMRQYVKYIKDKLMTRVMERIKLLAELVVGCKVDSPKLDKYLRQTFWRLVLKKPYTRKQDFAIALLKRAVKVLLRFKKMKECGLSQIKNLVSRMKVQSKVNVKSRNISKKQTQNKRKRGKSLVLLNNSLVFDNSWITQFKEDVIAQLQTRLEGTEFQNACKLVNSMIAYGEPICISKYIRDLVYVICRRWLLQKFDQKPWEVVNPRLEAICKLLWKYSKNSDLH
jgi:hypothetical protein